MAGPWPDKCGMDWPFGRDRDGYGKMKVDGESKRVHRLALAHKMGRPIRPGMQALHSCDRSECFNPNCLREGTHAENSQDAVERDRQSKGEEHGQAKLTERQALDIRAHYATGRWTQRPLAAKFGISQQLVSFIVNGKRWKHL